MKWTVRILGTSLLLLAIALGTGWWWWHGSLPSLEGERQVIGISAPVEITRDAQGLVHIEGETRSDIAFALGFVHAQERFFQMDLLRRNSAGELSELFGDLANAHDRRIRNHRFRTRALQNLAGDSDVTRRQAKSYSDGVNAGLADLDRVPFEYLVLGVEPAPWKPEDQFLALFSMTLVLQDETARFERGLGLMADSLPEDLYNFFAQQGGHWDAPLFGAPFEAAPVPLSTLTGDRLTNPTASALEPFEDDLHPGSNNWAVAGHLTAHGGALVANDMHLPIRVPNIWFRASWTHPAHGRLVSGVTLPGTSLMVAGSNQQLAWGFTNTQGDWSDVIILRETEDGTRYLTPDGPEAYETFNEVIQVKDAEPITVTVRETRWGPVIGVNHRGEPLVLRWTAHDPEGANYALQTLEVTHSVEDALRAAPGFGIPQQNLVMGDAQGNIGWTIAGPVPRRVNLDGVHPSYWDDGQHRWDGYLSFGEHPQVLNPPSGRIWTANARVVSDEALTQMGLQGAALGARQQQIRDALQARESFDESSMLDIQLDDRALFLERWRTRLLGLLNQEATSRSEALAAARLAVENWTGRADAEDPGYRIVRYFRTATLERALAPLETTLRAHNAEFRLSWVNRQMEYAGWTMLEAEPLNLLNPAFSSWRELQMDAINAVITPLYADGDLSKDNWGDVNRLSIRHPLAGALPLLGQWMSMPDTPMSGDTHMPRVQRSSFGASERFAVSPGREDRAYLHMATGQSAHPLSEFYGAGHDDWVQGRPSSWLAGDTRYRLRLRPAQDPGP